jgi:hypothetical protein
MSRPSQARRKRAAAKPKAESAVVRRVRLLEEHVARTVERLEGALNVVRDRLDSLESTFGQLIDELPEPQDEVAPTVNQKFLSGSWIRKDGTGYGPLQPQESAHVEGSSASAPNSGRALRRSGRRAS